MIEPVMPNEPGVYRFVGEENEVLYVGKAKNLRKRVASYFTKGTGQSNRIRLLVRKATNVAFTIVETEHDALLLENSLIKKHQPRYNINLKDNKTYPYLCIKNERFPRIFLTRKRVKDGSEYIGPFTSVTRVKTVLDFIRMTYPIRTCSLNLSEENIEKGKFKVCLEYHIGNCLGPCENLQSEADYNENITQIRDILKGNTAVVVQHLKSSMQHAAQNLHFEKAALLKKKLDLIEDYQSKSTVVSPTIDNVDVVAIEETGNYAFASYFRVINGAIIQTHSIRITKRFEEALNELLLHAVVHFRTLFNSQAKELILPFPIEYPGDLRQTIPQRGDKRKLLDLAEQNAKEYRITTLTRLEKHKLKHNENRVLQQLKQDFRMTTLPVHIECIDNSNIQGSHPVASVVVFKNGKPSKKDYRHYNIKGVEGPNDFASMEEVVYRRLARLQHEVEPLPHILLIDGGKGQLSSAMKSIDRLELRGQLVVAGIAKRLEEIYFPDDPVPLYIDKKSESLRLLQQIRNEAHRFAITFHRQKRSKSAINTTLEGIEGIGEKTARTLLRHFKSVKKIRAATLEELAQIVGKSKAQKVWKSFSMNADQ